MASRVFIQHGDGRDDDEHKINEVQKRDFIVFSDLNA